MRCLRAATWLLLAVVMAPCAVLAAPPNPFAGGWQFSFSGQDTGTGRATVDEQGHVQGAGHSNRFKMDLTLTGLVSPDGAFALTATPTGSTSTGATFTGQASGERASGAWHNDAAGLSGAWTAQRSGSGKGAGDPTERVHCQIDGESFDATPPVVADVVIPLHGDHWKFRLIAGHGLGLAPNGDRTQVEVKADQVMAPGSYLMSKAPLWRSVVLVKGREFKVDQGSFDLAHYAPRGDGRVAGNLTFDAGGHHGQCQFDVSMTVMDMPALMPKP